MSETKSALDVSHLPTYAYGTKNPLWWGTQAFMVIEGLGFVFSFATYLYFYNQNKSWPLGSAPPLFWSSIGVAVVVLSEIPNFWLKKKAKDLKLEKVRLGLLIMSGIGLLTLIIRAFEMKTMNIRWDENAYGSIIWFLLGLHTTHLLTDVVETWVMTFLIFKGPVDMRRFPEIEDNQDYWHFVVVFWILVYIVIYWFSRWLEVPAW
jgi:cytochrome c oxidase subunit 3